MNADKRSNSYYTRDDMPRVDAILRDTEYLKYVRQIEELETDRIFCRHNMEHFLSVARIACILNMEEECGIDRELIYATALLHDIGRGQEYLTGVRHEEESARLAPDIIKRAGFTDEEEGVILSAIRTHRDADSACSDSKSLNALIYRADKLSRACFYCGAAGECSKDGFKRNLSLRI
jgi:putative nucleotidyltransferase with HDIG domain